jgi:hypothetical protein
MSPNELNKPIYIKSKQLCARFRVSAMWLLRSGALRVNAEGATIH